MGNGQVTGATHDGTTIFTIPCPSVSAKDFSPLETCKFIHLPEWCQGNDVKVTELDPSHDEYGMASNCFQSTSSRRISKIERIENPNMYRRFAMKFETLCSNAGRKLTTQYLFHGTGETDPKRIYQHDFGVDFRHSGEGRYLGRGAYFAEKARYSEDYEHKLPNGEQQMFLCLVVTGSCYHYSGVTRETKKLIEPPMKKDGSFFDSTSVDQPWSKIYAVYDTDMSYPAYLITYKAN